MKGNLCEFLGVEEGDLLAINDDKLDMHIRIVNNAIFFTLDNFYETTYLMSDELSKEVCFALIRKGVTILEKWNEENPRKVFGSNVLV